MDEIKELHCKECGHEIQDGLCGWACKYDVEGEASRKPENMYYKVYLMKYLRDEPYTRP
jgi:hypothetical protein